MNDIIDAEEIKTTALATRQEPRPATVDELLGQVTLIQHVMGKVMKEKVHYGTVPGCGDKPTLLKPGAEKLMMTFRLAPKFEETVIDLPGGHREYRIKCTIVSIGSGQFIGQGVGSCCTMESKFRYRTERTDKEIPKAYWDTRDKSLIGGPSYDTRKIDGKWYVMHKVDHDNPADYYNTCLKMAKKRAHVDATITCTAASDIFQQDLDDLAENGVIATEPPPATRPEPTRRQPPIPADKSSASVVHARKADFIANADEIGHMQVWAWCVRNGCLPRSTPLEKINEAAVPDWKNVAADLALNDQVTAEEQAAYDEIYSKDGIPGLEHATDRTPKEDHKAAQAARGSSEAWKSFQIPFGEQRGTPLGDVDRKKLFGWWANYEPRKPEDKEFREALDEAGIHYAFTKKR